MADEQETTRGFVSDFVQDALKNPEIQEAAGELVSEMLSDAPSRPPPVAPQVEDEAVEAAEAAAADHVPSYEPSGPDATLRQRIGKGDGAGAGADGETDRALQDHLPSKEQLVAGAKKVRELLEKAKPVLAKAADVLEKAEPHIERSILLAQKYWKKVTPYHPEDLIPAIFGFAMVFFGSSFLVLITAIEAFYMTSWATTRDSFLIVYQHFVTARQAWKKDDKLDEDGDGVPDVEQLSDKQLVQRKLLLLVRSIDPQQLSVALTSIAAGLLAALAAVRTEFGKIIALGSAIGDVVYDLIEEDVVPALASLLPPEYAHWASPTVRYTFKSIVFLISFALFKVLAVAHATIRGGQLFAQGVLRYLVKNNMAPGVVSSLQKAQTGIVFDAACIGISVVGFLVQWYVFDFGLPFPLNWLLFPLVALEYVVATLAFWM